MVRAHRRQLKRDAADRTRRAAIGTRGGIATSTPRLNCGHDRDQHFQEKNCEDVNGRLDFIQIVAIAPNGQEMPPITLVFKRVS
jgi:hypothetical protein